jgi:hypothetical protein
MGFGAKTGIELNDGPKTGPEELRFLHRQWGHWVSEAMRASVPGRGAELDMDCKSTII